MNLARAARLPLSDIMSMTVREANWLSNQLQREQTEQERSRGTR